MRKFAEVEPQLLDRNGVKPSEIDLFVAHQANLRIIDAAKERLGLAEEKVVKNIHEYGNTTAATIPLALGTALDQGACTPAISCSSPRSARGFTVGTVLVRWSGVSWPA